MYIWYSCWYLYTVYRELLCVRMAETKAGQTITAFKSDFLWVDWLVIFILFLCFSAVFKFSKTFLSSFYKQGNNNKYHVLQGWS